MPLVSCPDCGNQISSEAWACPKCGRPTAKGNESRRRATIVFAVMIVASVAVTVIAGLRHR